MYNIHTNLRHISHLFQEHRCIFLSPLPRKPQEAPREQQGAPQKYETTWNRVQKDVDDIHGDVQKLLGHMKTIGSGEGKNVQAMSDGWTKMRKEKSAALNQSFRKYNDVQRAEQKALRKVQEIESGLGVIEATVYDESFKEMIEKLQELEQRVIKEKKDKGEKMDDYVTYQERIDEGWRQHLQEGKLTAKTAGVVFNGKVETVYFLDLPNFVYVQSKSRGQLTRYWGEVRTYFKESELKPGMTVDLYSVDKKKVVTATVESAPNTPDGRKAVYLILPEDCEDLLSRPSTSAAPIEFENEPRATQPPMNPPDIGPFPDISDPSKPFQMPRMDDLDSLDGAVEAPREDPEQRAKEVLARADQILERFNEIMRGEIDEDDLSYFESHADAMTGAAQDLRGVRNGLEGRGIYQQIEETITKLVLGAKELQKEIDGRRQTEWVYEQGEQVNELRQHLYVDAMTLIEQIKYHVIAGTDHEPYLGQLNALFGKYETRSSHEHEMAMNVGFEVAKAAGEFGAPKRDLMFGGDTLKFTVREIEEQAESRPPRETREAAENTRESMASAFDEVIDTLKSGGVESGDMRNWLNQLNELVRKFIGEAAGDPMDLPYEVRRVLNDVIDARGGDCRIDPEDHNTIIVQDESGRPAYTIYYNEALEPGTRYDAFSVEEYIESSAEYERIRGEVYGHVRSAKDQLGVEHEGHLADANAALNGLQEVDRSDLLAELQEEDWFKEKVERGGMNWGLRVNNNEEVEAFSEPVSRAEERPEAPSESSEEDYQRTRDYVFKYVKRAQKYFGTDHETFLKMANDAIKEDLLPQSQERLLEELQMQDWFNQEERGLNNPNVLWRLYVDNTTKEIRAYTTVDESSPSDPRPSNSTETPPTPPGGIERPSEGVETLTVAEFTKKFDDLFGEMHHKLATQSDGVEAAKDVVRSKINPLVTRAFHAGLSEAVNDRAAKFSRVELTARDGTKYRFEQEDNFFALKEVDEGLDKDERELLKKIKDIFEHNNIDDAIKELFKLLKEYFQRHGLLPAPTLPSSPVEGGGAAPPAVPGGTPEKPTEPRFEPREALRPNLENAEEIRRLEQEIEGLRKQIEEGDKEFDKLANTKLLDFKPEHADLMRQWLIRKRVILDSIAEKEKRIAELRGRQEMRELSPEDKRLVEEFERRKAENKADLDQIDARIKAGTATETDHALRPGFARLIKQLQDKIDAIKEKYRVTRPSEGGTSSETFKPMEIPFVQDKLQDFVRAHLLARLRTKFESGGKRIGLRLEDILVRVGVDKKVTVTLKCKSILPTLEGEPFDSIKGELNLDASISVTLGDDKNSLVIGNLHQVQLKNIVKKMTGLEINFTEAPQIIEWPAAVDAKTLKTFMEANFGLAVDVEISESGSISLRFKADAIFTGLGQDLLAYLADKAGCVMRVGSDGMVLVEGTVDVLKGLFSEANRAEIVSYLTKGGTELAEWVFAKGVDFIEGIQNEKPELFTKILSIVCESPALFAKVWSALSKDPERFAKIVTVLVANREKIAKVLIALGRNPNLFVKIAEIFAKNPKIFEKLVTTIGKNPEFLTTILTAMAKNPDLLISILTVMV